MLTEARKVSEQLAKANLDAWNRARQNAQLPDPFVWSNLTVRQLRRFTIACRFYLTEVR